MTGQQVGYTRVSTADQNLDRQLVGITLDRVFEEKASGKDTERPVLQAMLAHVRAGDTVHVHSMDRLARNLSDLLSLVKDLTGRGVSVVFHKEHQTFDGNESESSTLMLGILGAVAQFERSMILSRQREGIAAAQARGAYAGRPTALNASQVAEIKTRAAAGENKTALAKEFKVSRQTLYSALSNP